MQIFSQTIKTKKKLRTPTYFNILMLTCVCVCVYTLSPAGFFRLQDACDILEMFGSMIFCWGWDLGVSAMFLRLCFRIYHISPPKMSLQPAEKLERKRYDILESCEKIIYIDIVYKTTTRQAVKLRNDTKDKEATLI